MRALTDEPLLKMGLITNPHGSLKAAIPILADVVGESGFPG
jgi:hypothetical protein